MLRGSDASEAEAEARQLALGPPNELAVLAALSNADVIDVSGAEPIFDLLDTNGDGRLSAEELRQGVRSDAVVNNWSTPSKLPLSDISSDVTGNNWFVSSP